MIGSSTGGPNGLAEVIRALPADFPVPILIVQHMPADVHPALCRAAHGRCGRPGPRGGRRARWPGRARPGSRPGATTWSVVREGRHADRRWLQPGPARRTRAGRRSTSSSRRRPGLRRAGRSGSFSPGMGSGRPPGLPGDPRGGRARSSSRTRRRASSGGCRATSPRPGWRTRSSRSARSAPRSSAGRCRGPGRSRTADWEPRRRGRDPATADYEYLQRFLRDRIGHELGEGKEYLVESRLGPLAAELELGGDPGLFERLRQARCPELVDAAARRWSRARPASSGIPRPSSGSDRPSSRASRRQVGASGGCGSGRRAARPARSRTRWR